MSLSRKGWMITAALLLSVAVFIADASNSASSSKPNNRHPKKKGKKKTKSSKVTENKEDLEFYIPQRSEAILKDGNILNLEYTPMELPVHKIHENSQSSKRDGIMNDRMIPTIQGSQVLLSDLLLKSEIIEREMQEVLVDQQEWMNRYSDPSMPAGVRSHFQRMCDIFPILSNNNNNNNNNNDSTIKNDQKGNNPRDKCFFEMRHLIKLDLLKRLQEFPELYIAENIPQQWIDDWIDNWEQRSNDEDEKCLDIHRLKSNLESTFQVSFALSHHGYAKFALWYYHRP